MKKKILYTIKVYRCADKKETWNVVSIDDGYGITSIRINSKEEFLKWLKDYLYEHEFEKKKRAKVKRG